MEQYFTIVGLLDPREQAKFTVTRLVGRALTWWRQYCIKPGCSLGEIACDELLDSLKLEFQDIDREMKLRRKLANLK